MTSSYQRATQRWVAEHDPLTVIALVDPVVERLGHPVDSLYVEQYWTAILGPSSLLTLRRLVRCLDMPGETLEVPLGAFGAELGLGGDQINSPIVRTLARLVTFGCATIDSSRYRVRRALPTLSARHQARLPVHLRALHDLDGRSAGVGEGPHPPIEEVA